MRTLDITITAKDLWTALIELEDAIEVMKNNLPTSYTFEKENLSFKMSATGTDEPKPERKPRQNSK